MKKCPICKKINKTRNKYCCYECMIAGMKKSQQKRHSKGKQYLWMYVSNDKFELPLIVCDTPEELAEKRGVSTNTVRSSVSKYEHHGYSNYRRVAL